ELALEDESLPTMSTSPLRRPTSPPDAGSTGVRWSLRPARIAIRRATRAASTLWFTLALEARGHLQDVVSASLAPTSGGDVVILTRLSRGRVELARSHVENVWTVTDTPDMGSGGAPEPD